MGAEDRKAREDPPATLREALRQWFDLVLRIQERRQREAEEHSSDTPPPSREQQSIKR